MSGFAWRALAEPELVPYDALGTLPPSLLVVAPHPDDEVLGCGGLLALAAERGASIAVAVVSDGAGAGDAATREHESRAAAAVLGCGAGALQFWGLPDRGLAPDAALVARIRGAIEAVRPAWLLAPSPFEVHPDHRAVCLAAISAAAGSAARLGFYEVGQPLVANVLVDITAAVERKRAAVACFASQLALQRYDEQLLALNRYRAYTLGARVSHAEAYWFPDAADAGDAAAVQAALSRALARRLGQDRG